MGVISGIFRTFLYSTTVACLGALGSFLYQYKKKLKLLEPWEPVGKVGKLYVYPLKSGRKIEVQEAECTEVGLKVKDCRGYKLRDREFVVFNTYDNEQRTAKTYPKMVLIEVVSINENLVAFKAPGMITLSLRIPSLETNKETFVVGNRGEKIYSVDCGEEAATWISRYMLDKDFGLRVGYNDGSHRRDITKTHVPFLRLYPNLSNEAIGLYHDLASYILVNKESVEDLLSRIPINGITEDNFRPTILVEGAGAYDEDHWELIKIGEVVFEMVKPCTRGMSTTVNQQLGSRNQDREPLATLEKYRLVTSPAQRALEKNAPVMGLYLGLLNAGDIKVGDTVYVKK